MNRLKRVFKFLIPKQLYLWGIHKYFILRANWIKKRVLKYYRDNKSSDPEISEAVDYIARNGISVFPYSFIKNYAPSQYEAYFDDERQLPFTMYQGHRLYGKRGMSVTDMQYLKSGALLEQDLDSPHRYLTEDFNVREGDIVADIGVAEGNFSLSIVERAKAVYLFEADSEWIEPLHATFSPWKDKVHIISKFVANVDNESQISLDAFFGDIKPDFIKIDVDGAERPLLAGGEKLFTNPNALKVAICTYHKNEDAQEFASFFSNRKFNMEFSKGFMLFYYDNSLKAPFFRRGLIRASRF